MSQFLAKSRFENWKTGENYQLEKILGKGSYGEVAQGLDRSLH
jgi:hypothetical protein